MLPGCYTASLMIPHTSQRGRDTVAQAKISAQGVVSDDIARLMWAWELASALGQHELLHDATSVICWSRTRLAAAFPCISHTPSCTFSRHMNMQICCVADPASLVATAAGTNTSLLVHRLHPQCSKTTMGTIMPISCPQIPVLDEFLSCRDVELDKMSADAAPHLKLKVPLGKSRWPLEVCM